MDNNQQEIQKRMRLIAWCGALVLLSIWLGIAIGTSL